MMRDDPMLKLSRRRFLKVGAGLAGVAAAGAILPKTLLRPYRVEAAQGVAEITEPDLVFAATDGWISLPPPPVGFYHPDNMAPDPFTTYVFGFRDVTGLTREQTLGQKMKCQLSSPMWWIDQEQDFYLKLTNLGLQIRPDLIDAHTLHFHGFRNAIPVFDGEPHSSVGVPIARDLTYFYRPHDPGTYLYHCHFEETEHVHMGMVGLVFVRAAMGPNFAYNDPSTQFDREFGLCLNEVWSFAHWCDSHVQLPEWSDYNPDFYLMNGRAYPDTIAPNGGGRDPVTGDLIPPPGPPGDENRYAHLQYQPLSSLIQCNSGDRVLLRIANVGYVESSMRLTGVPMRVVGHDATLLRGRDGTDLSYYTDTLLVGAGQSADAIFVAPEVTAETRLLLYNRNYARLTNAGGQGYGGQMTEIRVFPASTLPPQTAPNT